MNSYQDAVNKLGDRQRRKIANNTYLELISDYNIGVRLHNTHVVIFKPCGDIILDSGGWKTSTTKDRINRFSPVRITQRNYYWFLQSGIEFYDGLILKGPSVTVEPKETHDLFKRAK